MSPKSSPGRKRKGSAKKKGGKKKGEPAEQRPRDVLPPLVLDRLQWVRLNLRLVTWEHGNFSLTVPARFTVGAVVRAIEERFEGTVSGVEMFRDRLGDDNRLDENKTLEDCGMRGGPEGDPPQYTVVYDFPPNHLECPLLNVETAARAAHPPHGERPRALTMRGTSTLHAASVEPTTSRVVDRTPLF